MTGFRRQAEGVPGSIVNIVNVVRPGLVTTIQDEGRWGYQSSGVPVAGPMDPLSHRLANALVGNDRSAATLEATLIGPELQFEDERVVAVSGAEFDLSLDGHPVRVGTSFVAPAGASLAFGERRRGARAYVAIEGGIAVPPVLGSRATHLVTAMGGLGGRALQAGDDLPLGDRRGTVGARPMRTTAALDAPAGPACLRVLPGPHHQSFTAGALELLLSAPYAVSTASDRMGFRLEGPALTDARKGDIISEATTMGALQVPSAGQPILLMADRQTTGGYPTIATVITADISVAGQLAPGDRVMFVACSAREAMEALVALEHTVMAVEAGSRS